MNSNISMGRNVDGFKRHNTHTHTLSLSLSLSLSLLLILPYNFSGTSGFPTPDSRVGMHTYPSKQYMRHYSSKFR